MKFSSIIVVVLGFGLFCASSVQAISPLNSGDLLCDAIPITVDAPEITGDNSIASAEPNEPLGSCWWTANPLNSIWYSFIAPSSGRVSVSTSFDNTSLDDTHIAIYDVGNCSDMTTLTELACDEDSGLLFTAEATVNDLIPGKTYYIQVDGYEDKVGKFKIKVSELQGCTGLTSPQNGMVNVPLNEPLAWSTVLGMSNYTVTITGPSGASNLINNLDLGNAISYQPPQNWSPNTTYQVTILAFNDQNDTISCPASSFTTTSFTAQIFGPGGVIAHDAFWAKADKGISFLGSKIMEWKDQSTLSHDATQTDTAYQPILHPNRLNYNPGVYFDGNNDYLAIANLITPNSKNISVFAVGTNEQGGDTWHAMVFGQSNSNWTNGGYGICGLDGAANSFGFWVNNWSEHAVATPLIRKKATILEGKYEGSQIAFYKNADLEGSAPYSGEIGDAGNTFLGGGAADDYNHKGYISEVVIYDSDLAENDRRKINSYLAIKYGITLSREAILSNYVNSQGQSIFSADSAFWHNIIGIGRDDAADLLQKQSHQADDSTRVYLASLKNSNSTNQGDFGTDNQFIVIGHNNKPMVSSLQQSSAPLGISRVTHRAWRIQNTNFSGSFSIEFLLDDCSLKNTNNIKLLVSDNPDFSNAQIFNQLDDLTISKNGSWLRIAGISNSHINKNTSAYISIGTSQNLHPFSKTICSGSSLIINGTIYDESNPSGIELFTNSMGCDSLVEVNLSFESSTPINFNRTLCHGDSMIINNTTYDEQNPIGTEIFHNIHGCDSIVNIQLFFQQNIQTDYHQNFCPGDSIIINGTIYNEQNPNGTETLSTTTGCDSIIYIDLLYASDYPLLEDDHFKFNSANTQEESIITNDILPDDWSLFVNNTNHPSWFQLQSNGTITLYPPNTPNDVLTIEYILCNSTCDQLCDTADIYIEYPLPNNEVYVSDVLTLNGDGKNDQLIFKNINALNNEGIQIYNRWGNLIFAQAPYQNNWDGKNQNGELLPNGTYYYILNINRANGDIIQGDVLLIR